MERFDATHRRKDLVGLTQLVGVGFVLALILTAVGFAPRPNSSAGVDPAAPAQLPFLEASDDPLSTAGALWFDTANADEVRAAFASEFSKLEPEIDWRGSHDSCDGGSSSETLRAATIDRVNFYRAMAGVPAVVVENDEYSLKAHAGAIMMSAQGELSHEPSESFACFSEAGFEAAANSNLYLGRTGPEAVDGYIEDPGEDNIDVGHRNTLLHPPTKNMGVANVAASGDYNKANLLWVFDEDVFEKAAPTREPSGFVAWPPVGHVPPEIVYPRWSFSLQDADFSNAEVTMSRDGDPVDLDVVKVDGKPGRVPNPLIVWVPQLESSDQVRVYDVEVQNVLIAGENQSFSYQVRILEPTL